MISVEPGDELPPDLREAYQDEDASSIKFETSAEVIESFGGSCHVYPTKPIESVEDFLTMPAADSTDPRVCFRPDVRWYTQPREEL